MPRAFPAEQHGRIIYVCTSTNERSLKIVEIVAPRIPRNHKNFGKKITARVSAENCAFTPKHLRDGKMSGNWETSLSDTYFLSPRFENWIIRQKPPSKMKLGSLRFLCSALSQKELKADAIITWVAVECCFIGFVRFWFRMIREI